MKLTEKQIENWRKVLVGIVGPGALIMPVEDIERFRDRMEDEFTAKPVSLLPAAKAQNRNEN